MRSRKAIAEQSAPVSKVDRISFVILLSVSLLHAILLPVDINCEHGFRRRIYLIGKSTRKVEHADGYQAIGDRTRT